MLADFNRYFCMSFAINVRGSLGCNYRKKLLRTKEENKLNLNENMKKSSYKMMTKTLYVQVVCIIAIFEFFTQCLCSTSANSQNDDKTRISSIIPSKMLLDDFESVTTAKNLISEPNDLVIDDQIVKIGFQYFNDPLKISTPKYETIPEITYDNHQPIHQLDLNYSHLPQISNDDYAVQPQIIPSHHIVQVTREPIWAPEVIKLENQYISTFRSIRSSVMNFYYKMQNFVSYVMSFFSVGKSFFVMQFIKMNF